MLGLFPQQIVQNAEAGRDALRVHECVSGDFRSTRNIRMISSQAISDILSGRWEGDTLVVDTIGFNDKTWLAGAGTFHTEALHTVERFTRVDKDQINYEITMEDPNVFH
jgi:hypothetical protein